MIHEAGLSNYWAPGAKDDEVRNTANVKLSSEARVTLGINFQYDRPAGHSGCSARPLERSSDRAHTTRLRNPPTQVRAYLVRFL